MMHMETMRMDTLDNDEEDMGNQEVLLTSIKRRSDMKHGRNEEGCGP